MIASSPSMRMSMLQSSRPNGWQKGMSSWVRLAAITPATMAVWKTGPLAVAKSRSASALAASGGKATVTLACAVRCVTVFPPTSTMRGCPRSSRCVRSSRFTELTADVIHFDLFDPHLAAAFRAQLAVAVAAVAPHAVDDPAEFRIVHAAAHRPAQVRAPGSEQACVNATVRGKAGPRAVAAERLRDRADEADLPGAVLELPALGDFAAVAGLHRPDRPARLHLVHQFRGRHEFPLVPLVQRADVHVLDETYHHARVAEPLQQGIDAPLVESPLHHRVDLDGLQPRLDGGINTFQDPLRRAATAAHAPERRFVQGIQADGDAIEARALKSRRMLGEQNPVGGESEVLDALNQAQLTDEVDQPRTQQGLAAGESQLGHAARHEQARKPDDLLEREALVRVQELEVAVVLVLRHAIRATEIATVHDRDPQVAQRPAAAILELHGVDRLRVRSVSFWIHALPSFRYYCSIIACCARPGLAEPGSATDAL